MGARHRPAAARDRRPRRRVRRRHAPRCRWPDDAGKCVADGGDHRRRTGVGARIGLSAAAAAARAAAERGHAADRRRNSSAAVVRRRWRVARIRRQRDHRRVVAIVGLFDRVRIDRRVLGVHVSVASRAGFAGQHPCLRQPADRGSARRRRARRTSHPIARRRERDDRDRREPGAAPEEGSDLIARSNHSARGRGAGGRGR